MMLAFGMAEVGSALANERTVFLQLQLSAAKPSSTPILACDQELLDLRSPRKVAEMVVDLGMTPLRAQAALL